MVHRRPLNAGIAHYQELVHNGTIHDPSPSQQGWDDDNEVVEFVVRWDVIPGITHQRNRPQTSNNSSGNPLLHSNAKIARRTTTLKHREIISGARGWARGPVASSPSLSVRPTVTSSGSKRDENALRSTDENDLKFEVARNLKQLLRTYSETFAKSTDDLDFCSLLEHDIDTGDARPIKQSPRRPPLAACDSENQILDEM